MSLSDKERVLRLFWEFLRAEIKQGNLEVTDNFY